MLAAKCPQCGAVSPVSLAAPEHLHCRYCQYAGSPDPAVVAELHHARAALWQIDTGRRQLSSQQRRMVERAQGQSLGLMALLALVSLPLLLCGGCSTWVFIADDLHTSSLPFLVVGLFPPALVLGLGLLLLRIHRGGVQRLARSCAAVPPSAPGQPALCHVCGAPLTSEASRGVVRCGFCQADNVVASDIMKQAAQQQTLVMSSMHQSITTEATRLSHHSVTTLLLTLVTALASPVLALLLMCGATMVLKSIPAEVDENEEYAALSISGTTCFASLERKGGGYEANLAPRFPHRPNPIRLTPAELKVVKVKDLMGRQVLLEGNRPAKVVRLERTQGDRHTKLVLEGGDRFNVRGACEPPPNLTMLAKLPSLNVCRAMQLHGDTLTWVTAAGEVVQMPKAGGAARTLFNVGAHIERALSERKAAFITPHPNRELYVIELTQGATSRFVMRDVHHLAFAGPKLVFGNVSQVYLDEEAGPVRLHSPGILQALVANRTHVVYHAQSKLYALPITGGAPRVIGTGFSDGLGIAGDQVLFGQAGCKVIPLAGGPAGACPLSHAAIQLHPERRAFEHRGRVYWPAAKRSSNHTPYRGGVLSHPVGGSLDRHYGPTSTQVQCAAVDDEFIYWVDGQTLLRDKLAQ
ncbi:MAG: hypothetical protein KIT72_17075 [Polyangiaceae bacterium]|nr:hypothetical protein [Polyangiaceae bacterium]MCW5792131.1 hypothetical protein [Polyangiaceae bacterium]